MTLDNINHHLAVRPRLDNTHTVNTAAGDPGRPLDGLGDLHHQLSISPPISGTVTLWTPAGSYRHWNPRLEQLSRTRTGGPDTAVSLEMVGA